MIDHKKELEEFTYIVSHDFNSPFRHIREFSKILIDKLDDRLTDEERKYAYFINKGVHKVEAMLDALLEYSRLNTEELQKEKLKTADILKNTVARFNEDIQEIDATIEINEIVETIWGDQKRIETLFFNVIDNSLKFRRTEDRLLVSISSEESEEGIIFKVRDNGIGIPAQKTEDVFKVFNQLHAEGEYPGIGIGLPIAQKIARLHGGKTWIESNEQTGITVFIQLMRQ